VALRRQSSKSGLFVRGCGGVALAIAIAGATTVGIVPVDIWSD
jgi:hypothetical protein